MFGLSIPIQVQASIALLLSQLSFSGWHILGSVSFHDGADPLVFCMYRIILGTALMHAYVWYYGMSMVIDSQDYLRFFFLGVLSFLSMVLTAFCLTYIAPSRFAIFQPSIPCIVAGLSMISGLEKLSRLKVFGIVVAVGGAILAEMWKFKTIDSAELDIPLGTGLALGQVLAMGLLLVGVKPLLGKYQPAVVSCVYFSVATVATVLLCLARIDTFPPGAFQFNHQYMPWVALVYAAVFTTLFAFIALSWGSKYLNPSASTAYFTFQPLGTIVLSAVILGSVVTLPEVVGGLMIIVGLGITSAAALLGTDEEDATVVGVDSNNHVTTSTVLVNSDSNNIFNNATSLMKVAYKKPSLLTRLKSSSFTYGPLSTDDAADIEMGEITLSGGSEWSGTANTLNIENKSDEKMDLYISSTDEDEPAANPILNPNNDDCVGTKFTNDSSGSPNSVHELLAPNIPIIRVRNVYSANGIPPSPVRQRSVTVDSSPCVVTNANGATKLHKNGLLRRNQNSFNA